VPDMREHDIEENMSIDSLHLICGDPGSVDYFDLPEAERERYDQFMEAPTAPTSRHCECDRRRASSLLMWETMLQTATEERCLRGIVRPVARLASTQRREE
jgi:hypothetical protein